LTIAVAKRKRQPDLLSVVTIGSSFPDSNNTNNDNNNNNDNDNDNDNDNNNNNNNNNNLLDNNHCYK